MGNKTQVKQFRYPERNDAVSEVDIANLINDFDIEVANQLASTREKLRHRPYAVMGDGSFTVPSATNTAWKYATVDDPLGLGSLTTGAFTISAAAGGGVYFTYAYASFSSPNTVTSFEVSIQAGGAYASRTKRNYYSATLFSAAIVSVAVGSTIQASSWQNGSGTTTVSSPLFLIVKLSD